MGDLVEKPQRKEAVVALLGVTQQPASHRSGFLPRAGITPCAVSRALRRFLEDLLTLPSPNGLTNLTALNGDGSLGGKAMFESAELGHKLDKETFRREAPAARQALLDAQFDLLERPDFPVIILIRSEERRVGKECRL